MVRLDRLNSFIYTFSKGKQMYEEFDGKQLHERYEDLVIVENFNSEKLTVSKPFRFEVFYDSDGKVSYRAKFNIGGVVGNTYTADFQANGQTLPVFPDSGSKFKLAFKKPKKEYWVIVYRYKNEVKCVSSTFEAKEVGIQQWNVFYSKGHKDYSLIDVVKIWEE